MNFWDIDALFFAYDLGHGSNNLGAFDFSIENKN